MSSDVLVWPVAILASIISDMDAYHCAAAMLHFFTCLQNQMQMTSCLNTFV
jgi:hypothetical protein